MISTLLLALFLFTLAVTHFELLHKLLHEGAGHADHYCVVTLLQSGTLESPACDVAVVFAEVRPLVIVCRQTVFVPSVDHFLPLSCGPPAFPA